MQLHCVCCGAFQCHALHWLHPQRWKCNRCTDVNDVTTSQYRVVTGMGFFYNSK